MSTPLATVRNLERLYTRGFRDRVTDSALLKVAMSQIARDETVLRDLERDLADLEQQYQMSSEVFYQRWQAGQLGDAADFMDWNALYQMACQVRDRLNVLRDESTPYES
ncbi:MAG TPA: hypothetical protein PKZ84_18620 [Anaerolineae bacterium]|nr:hypothetical protein [Anaerolineae bacterium]HQI86614.1 hypothetical protein [Anaerolineae bacterium]